VACREGDLLAAAQQVDELAGPGRNVAPEGDLTSSSSVGAAAAKTFPAVYQRTMRPLFRSNCWNMRGYSRRSTARSFAGTSSLRARWEARAMWAKRGCPLRIAAASSAALSRNSTSRWPDVCDTP
jgi:hypothetical protein